MMQLPKLNETVSIKARTYSGRVITSLYLHTLSNNASGDAL